MKSKLRSVFSLFPQKDLLGIVERFYARMSTDVLVGFFFRKKDIREIARKQTLFMLQSAGIPAEDEISKPHSSIKPPIHAHDNLPPILSGHFDRRLILLKEHLEFEFAANPQFIQNKDTIVATWLEFEGSFRKQIVKES